MPNARQLFLRDPDTGRIRFTRAGMEKYRARFARAGYDMKAVRTMTEFEAAADASFAEEMRQLAATAKGEDPELDAILKGLPGWD